MTDTKSIATRFMLLGIQHWGQTDEKRRAATEAYLTAAGVGTDRAGYEWLEGVMRNLRRGEVNDEIAQLQAALSPQEDAPKC